jgi:transcriptional regulator with XRE-family HTH domain
MPEWYQSKLKGKKELEDLVEKYYQELKLHQELRAMRENAGLSQARAAELAHMSPGHLSRIEAGKADNLEVKTLLRLAAVCGVKISGFATKPSVPTVVASGRHRAPASRVNRRHW